MRGKGVIACAALHDDHGCNVLVVRRTGQIGQRELVCPCAQQDLGHFHRRGVYTLDLRDRARGRIDGHGVIALIQPGDLLERTSRDHSCRHRTRQCPGAFGADHQTVNRYCVICAGGGHTPRGGILGHDQRSAIAIRHLPTAIQTERPRDTVKFQNARHDQRRSRQRCRSHLNCAAIGRKEGHPIRAFCRDRCRNRRTRSVQPGHSPTQSQQIRAETAHHLSIGAGAGAVYGQIVVACACIQAQDLGCRRQHDAAACPADAVQFHQIGICDGSADHCHLIDASARGDRQRTVDKRGRAIRRRKAADGDLVIAGIRLNLQRAEVVVDFDPVVAVAGFDQRGVRNAVRHPAPGDSTGHGARFGHARK